MRILFMGTPDFAVFSLRAMVESGEEIVGVVTQPDQPKGRGYVLTPPPVKVYAEAHGIPVCQPEKLKTEEFAARLQTFAPDLIVVAAYGKILPAQVLDYPKYGCINIHGSLLPAYRGAAPIQRAILDGKTETGITTMQMDAGLDTGDILFQEAVPITNDDNFETLHDKMGECGARVLIRTLDALRAGTLKRTAQDGANATYAAKIEKDDCAIDFTKPAEVLHNQIRGLSPIPLAFTHTPDGKILKVKVAEPVDEEPTAAPGTVISTAGGAITVACGTGAIRLWEVVPEGKKPMSAAAYLNGRKLTVGAVLRT